MIRQSLLLLFLGCTLAALAQPALHSCHGHRSLLPLHPLSAQQEASTRALQERSDTIDVLNYDITLDVTDFAGQRLVGHTNVRFTPKMDGVDHIHLDLAQLTVDSVTHSDGTPATFVHSGELLRVEMDQTLTIGEEYAVTVFYQGTPMTCPSGFGGFYFEDGYAYNLGIGLQGDPHNFGRAWFPCFDNFVERSTYDYHLITNGGRTGVASGDFLGVEDLGNDYQIWHYRMDQTLPTYLSAVGVFSYQKTEYLHPALNGDLPVEIYAGAGQTSAVLDNFETLPGVIDALEYWFGPYPYHKVGYHMTTRGAMEHAQSIAYPVGFATSDSDNLGLIAHELAHHWWGNIVTPMTQADMWVKEGAAEYGDHLAHGWIRGEEAFVDLVRSNLMDVLTQYHREDGDYLALSPLSWENTYSRHTYYKGAAVFHNLRAYLGDSLFRSAMTEFQTLAYETPVDDVLHRQYLEQASGMDLGNFYDAWITAPGYSDFEVQASDYAVGPNGYEVSLTIDQKLYRAPAFHQGVPVSVTFIDENLQEETQQVTMSGASMDFQLTAQVEPKMIILNHHQLMNLGRMQDYRVLDQTGDAPLRRTGMRVDVETIGDPVPLGIVHHFTAPDAPQTDLGVTLSPTHYWTVRGLFPTDGSFQATARVQYDARPSSMQLDTLLADMGEDSLVMMWRPNAQTEWSEHPAYEVFTLNPNDGFGFMRINQLLPGDYTFGRGTPLVSNTTSPVALDALRTFPNPTSEQLQIRGVTADGSSVRLEITDAHGRLWHQADAPANFFVSVDVHSWTSGVYQLHIRDAQGRQIAVRSVVVR